LSKNKSASKVDLKPLDELLAKGNDQNELSIFNTLEKQKDVTIEVPLSMIDDFPNHPFKVINDESMQELVQSIKEYGLINPAIVRKKEDGRYELVSGHRRKMACELAGLTTMKVTVRELDRDEATIIMVDSNMQREQILPSEKAFAYKMKLDALNSRGKRNDLTLCPIGTKLHSAYLIAKNTGDSTRQVFRYIRLTELIPEILEMVDQKQIGFQPAVELSYLTRQEQLDLLETMQSEERTPSLAQAQRMKRLSADGRLNIDVIFSIMTEEKPNEKEKIVIPRKSIEAYIPKGLSRNKEVEYVTKALEYYQRYLQRQREKSFER